ncbi:hypothetical protein [Paenibacillus sp. HB172176]|uniref:hypothetical protein n=1 Tax=Paenibacillus sp. HB172176 TaxID=2493690 RepID=UPI001F11172C|nr:hypothetical protein [Paenibacillus sp. HB172176]
MYRYHYRAQLRFDIEPQSYFRETLPQLRARMKEIEASHLSLFSEGSCLFLYYESPNEEVDPRFLFAGCEAALEQWPGENMTREWVPMMDIFHYQMPFGDVDWRPASKKSAKPFARIARLKPDKVASYVFYHYQYQEEKPGDGDKYGIIALNENLLFFYSEQPATIAAPPYEGMLATSATPRDWAAAMLPHFIPWNSSTEPPQLWKEISLVARIDEP